MCFPEPLNPAPVQNSQEITDWQRIEYEHWIGQIEAIEAEKKSTEVKL